MVTKFQYQDMIKLQYDMVRKCFLKKTDGNGLLADIDNSIADAAEIEISLGMHARAKRGAGGHSYMTTDV